MKTAVIIGANSDIAKGIMPMLEADGYNILPWARDTLVEPWHSYSTHRGVRCETAVMWDLFICFIGSVAPVRLWHEPGSDEWCDGVNSNVIKPFQLLHHAWSTHAPNATVCFFAGSNPQMIMPGYSAYNTGKMALLKLVEQLDYETPDAKFFALGPGIVLTKIHEASEGWDNPKLKAAQAEGKSTPMQDIYDCLMWCVGQPKEVVGGRNICVSDMQHGPAYLAHCLEIDHDLFKLRRVE